MRETLFLCSFHIFFWCWELHGQTLQCLVLNFGRLNPVHGVISNSTHQDSSTKQNDKICARKTWIVTEQKRPLLLAQKRMTWTQAEAQAPSKLKKNIFIIYSLLHSVVFLVPVSFFPYFLLIVLCISVDQKKLDIKLNIAGEVSCTLWSHRTHSGVNKPMPVWNF